MTWQIQWHVIPEPPATLQGAATWQIQCHDSTAIHFHQFINTHKAAVIIKYKNTQSTMNRKNIRVTLQGAAAGRIQWHVIPEPRITLQGAATW